MLEMKKDTTLTGDGGRESDFDASKHPRDGNGQFTRGSGDVAAPPKKTSKIMAAANSEADKHASMLGVEYKGYKGKKAIEKLWQEKQGHVKGAFHRNGIGDIDLVWGNDKCGLKHIIMRREADGTDFEGLLNSITNIIEKGRIIKVNDRGNYEIELNNKIVVIAPDLSGRKINFLLTAYETRKSRSTTNK